MPPSPILPQKVVVLGSYAPSLINFRGPLIAEMVARGHKVFALAPGLGEAVAGQVRALGAEPVPIRLARTSLNPLGAFATVRDLRRTLSRIAPDVVFAYTIKPIILGAAALKGSGTSRFVPIVTGIGYAFETGLGPKRFLVRTVATTLYKRAFRRAAVAIFQNEDDRRDFRRLGILRPALASVVVAGSGVDLDRFAERPLPDELSLLMIGRFLRGKGIREFGEAATRLIRDFPNARVRLVGWVDESPDSLSQEEVAGLTAAGIENLGQLDDVRPALAQCSVYVLPSYREGTPRSVLEAMATGRAIVTTDAPGCRETVIEGENGFLVPVGDSDALYRAMRRFAEDPSLCAPMGAASRRLAETRFDVRKVNRDMLDHAGL